MKTAVRRGLFAAGWVILGVAALGGGCGKGGVARLPLWGTVSGAHGEAPSGSITFLPDKGRPGPSATTRLIAGQYRFDWKDGPTAGPHRVIVSEPVAKEAALKALAQDSSPAPSEAADGGRKTEWTLSADVPAAAPYRCDLKLAP